VLACQVALGVWLQQLLTGCIPQTQQHTEQTHYVFKMVLKTVCDKYDAGMHKGGVCTMPAGPTQECTKRSQRPRTNQQHSPAQNQAGSPRTAISSYLLPTFAVHSHCHMVWPEH
jgi:hypothetical protein